MKGETVVQHTPTSTTLDGFGNPRYSWSDTTLKAVPVWPVEGAAVSDRSVAPIRLSMIVPGPVGVDDQFTVRGVRARQYRTPMQWVNPHLVDGGRGVQVYVERIVG